MGLSSMMMINNVQERQNNAKGDEYHMGSNSKEVRLNQQTYWEGKLDERMSVLNTRGLDSEKIAKDRAIRKIRAEIRKAGSRLQVIQNLEKKAHDMAEAKIQKAPDGKKKKAGKGKESEEREALSKRQQKKKAKKEKKQEEGTTQP